MYREAGKGQTENQGFEKRYNCQYPVFCLKISDEKQIEKIEAKHPTWEADNAEWEYRQKELEEWKGKLEDILMKS